MITDLPLVDQLPRQSASHVKNKWRDLVREVHAAGTVAITNHATVEMVLMDVSTYEQLAARAAALKARESTVLDELSAQFNRRLTALQEPDAANKLAAVLASKGKLRSRPKAGSAF